MELTLYESSHHQADQSDFVTKWLHSMRHAILSRVMRGWCLHIVYL
jgi:hypothetical protein